MQASQLLAGRALVPASGGIGGGALQGAKANAKGRIGPLTVRAAKGTKTKKKTASKTAAPPAAGAPAPVPGLLVSETAEPNSRVRLTVTVPESVCKQSWDKAIRDISKEIQIDGFRKGDRVPEYLLVRHVGEDAIKRQVLEQLLHSTISEALETVAGRALKESEHIAQKAEDLIATFSVESPLKYDVTVDVIPEVKWASERAYAGMTVEVQVEDESKVAEAVENIIRSRQKDLGSLKVSTADGLEMGNVAIVDISSFRINDDGSLGNPILSATQKGFQVDTEAGMASLLPGFVEALLGVKRGETKEFDLAFPDTWQQESLRGVTARFQVLCQEIFVRSLPELDDAIADQFMPGAQSIDEVRENVSKVWLAEQEQKKRQATMLALVNALGDVCEMEVPNSLLEEQGRQMYGAKLIELQAGGRLSKEDTAQLMTEQMVNNYLVSQKSTIERQVKQALAVQEVFRLEGLTYTDEELAAEVQSAVTEFKAYGQEYDEKRVKEQAAELLEGAKVLEWLTANSTINYVTKS